MWLFLTVLIVQCERTQKEEDIDTWRPFVCYNWDQLFHQQQQQRSKQYYLLCVYVCAYLCLNDLFLLLLDWHNSQDIFSIGRMILFLEHNNFLLLLLFQLFIFISTYKALHYYLFFLLFLFFVIWYFLIFDREILSWSQINPFKKTEVAPQTFTYKTQYYEYFNFSIIKNDYFEQIEVFQHREPILSLSLID